ncbi:MAG: RNA polymerase sigma factor, partial [Verrucomicrobia bacterium]|nr:RNA polymerase sigma factor [Verrucomicrobiota bacterium]
DFLRAHQRNREMTFSDVTTEETNWLEQFVADPSSRNESAAEAREIVAKVMAKLSPPARLILNLLEIEERSVKEISRLTGWSVPLVKVRAFRARAEMRKILEKMIRKGYV